MERGHKVKKNSGFCCNFFNKSLNVVMSRNPNKVKRWAVNVVLSTLFASPQASDTAKMTLQYPVWQPCHFLYYRSLSSFSPSPLSLSCFWKCSLSLSLSSKQHSQCNIEQTHPELSTPAKLRLISPSPSFGDSFIIATWRWRAFIKSLVVDMCIVPYNNEHIAIFFHPLFLLLTERRRSKCAKQKQTIQYGTCKV